MADTTHECSKCLCFDLSTKKCKFLSREDGNPLYYRIADKLFPIGKISTRRLRRKEVGFEWVLSDGIIYVERGISHIRKCSYGVIVSEYLRAKNKRVLEIAPRYSRFLIQKQLKLNGCEYFSFTASKRELEKGNTESVKETPIKVPGNYCAYTSEIFPLFERNFFDIIIGTQGFEHWREIDICEKENKNAYQAGLDNCHTILRSGGWFMQNFPVGHHGDKLFVSGDISGIKRLFDPQKWTNVDVTEWGKYSASEKKVNKWVGLVKAMKI